MAMLKGFPSPITGMDLKYFLDLDAYKVNSSVYDNLGIPVTNRFACLLNGPKQLGENGWLEFQVMSVDCPGISIETNTMELNGINRYSFKGRSYDDLQITFLDTSDLALRDYFYKWISLAVNIDSIGGVRRSYLSEIQATDFVIAPLDSFGVARRCDRFFNTFPIKIQDQNYNYATAGEIIKTTVTFKYMFHKIDTIHPKTDSEHISTKEKEIL
jgi:hypothetical protein